ncbi:MAG TPA: hypothetical protein VKV96_11180 [Roseiarcus sp.]|nr:hypothetical protein [Roseiarcus sp.]
MHSTPTKERLNFLYRRADGAIGRRDWALASLAPTIVIVALTLIWLAIMPRQARDPSQGLVDLGVAARYVYLILYAFIVLICAVAQYFVSAKRFIDLGKPPALAGAAPFALFFAAAANWYEPRSEGLAPHWVILAFDAIAIAAVVWNIVELGFVKGRRASPLRAGERQR